MSEEQLNAFLQKVKSDTELQEKLKASADADANAVVAIAKEAGFSITAEDIQSAPEELSDEELNGAAGGAQRVEFPRMTPPTFTAGRIFDRNDPENPS